MVEDAAGMFDEEYYRQQRPDLHNSGMDLWEHYAGYGWREGSRPHSLFDPVHYLSQTATDGAEPFEHYLHHGWRVGLWPHLLFDPAHYAAQTGDTGEAPLVHYARVGWRDGLWPHPLFDPVCQTSPHGDPLRHYLLTGWRRGAQPHPLFDPGFYFSERPDLAGGVEPLQHYLAHGWSEGSRPHPLFDPVHYRTQGVPGMPDLLHYVRHGEAAGLRPNALFSPFYYRAVHAALVGDAPPLAHYVRFGEALGLATAPEFRAARYGSRHLWHGGQPLSHALRHGVTHDDSPPAAWPPAPRPAFDGPVRPLLLLLIGPAGRQVRPCWRTPEPYRAMACRPVPWASSWLSPTPEPSRSGPRICRMTRRRCWWRARSWRRRICNAWPPWNGPRIRSCWIGQGT